MTSAILVIALLTAADARQHRADASQLVPGPRVDLLGDGDLDATGEPVDEAAELQAALFGDWTMADELA